MNVQRRGFLQLLGIGTAGALLPRPATPPARDVRRICLLEEPVAGFQHHAGMNPAVAAALSPGVPLVLRREPGNPFDARAVALHLPGLNDQADGPHLGYLSRRINVIPARLLDEGAHLEAVVAAFDAEGAPWERLTVAVYACLKATDPPATRLNWAYSGLVIPAATAPGLPSSTPPVLWLPEAGTLPAETEATSDAAQTSPGALPSEDSIPPSSGDPESPAHGAEMSVAQGQEVLSDCRPVTLGEDFTSVHEHHPAG